MHDLTKKLSDDYFNELEEIITQAINSYLGTNNWDIKDLEGRGHWINHSSIADKWERYLYFDGYCILKMTNPQVVVDNDGFMCSKFNYTIGCWKEPLDSIYKQYVGEEK